MKLTTLSLAFPLLMALAGEADAFCTYHGAMYAKTTVEQEFRDSALVIEGHVISAREVHLDPDEYGYVYQIRVDHIFKGHVRSAVIANYTGRDSGGFYLDLGADYLLFLDRNAENKKPYQIAPRALRINYNCGQSGKIWDQQYRPDSRLPLLEKMSRQTQH